MQLQFVVGKEIKFTKIINYTREDLLGMNNIKNDFSKTQKFKIPLNVIIIFNFRKAKIF